MTTNQTLTVSETVKRIKNEGWCVIPAVIPMADLEPLYQAVVQQEIAQREEWQAVSAGFAGAGQQQPPRGVGHAQALVNYIPELSGFIASPQIVKPVEALLGPFLRVSSVSGLVNFPGNERGYWHADWPFNQTLATYMPAPYPDVVAQISGIFMFSEFSSETGGTWVVPGSHRETDNPTSNNRIDRLVPHKAEVQVSGTAGSLLLYDSRLWHAVASNRSDTPRVAVTIRYAPWWFNLTVRRKGSPEFQRMVVQAKGKDNSVPLIPKSVFDSFCDDAKPLFMHWLES